MGPIRRPLHPLLAIAFALPGGGLYGMIPTLMLETVTLPGSGLSVIEEVDSPADLVLSFIFGCVVGVPCVIPAVIGLTGRDRRSVYWMMCGVMPLVIVVQTVLLRLRGDTVLSLWAWAGIAFTAACVLVALFVPIVRSAATMCRVCGYDLRGSIESGRCPECGQGFDVETVRVAVRGVSKK